MSEKLDLNEIRNKIDSIDDELIKLFEERMQTVNKVAEYKIQNNMQILNSKREREIVNRLSEKVSPRKKTTRFLILPKGEYVLISLKPSTS